MARTRDGNAPGSPSALTPNSIELTNDRAATVAREYGLSVIKGLVGAVPYAGSLLNEVMFEARSRLKQARLEGFLVGLAARVAQLREEALDMEYMRSPEFSDLVEDVCLRVARSSSQARRDHFQAVLLHAMTGQKEPDFGPLFIDVLTEISEAELAILHQVCDATRWLLSKEQQGVKAELKPYDYSGEPVMGHPPEVFRSIIQSLVRKGLAYDDSFGRFDSRAYTFVRATDLGVRFLAWLTHRDA